MFQSGFQLWHYHGSADPGQAAVKYAPSGMGMAMAYAEHFVAFHNEEAVA